MSPRLRRLEHLLFLLGIWGVVLYVHLLWSFSFNWDNRWSWQSAFVAGAAVGPYRTRVLLPGLIAWLSPVPSMEWAFVLEMGLDALTLGLLLAATLWYLLAWFERPQAYLGVAFLAVVLPVALRDWGAHAWTWLEATLYLVILRLAADERDGWIPPLVALAAFNRETAVFLPLVYGVATGGRRPWIVRRSLWAWLLVYGGLYVGIPRTETLHSAATSWYLLRHNLSDPWIWWLGMKLPALFGAFWWFAARGMRRSPRLVRRAAWGFLVYLASVAVFGVWSEIRLLLPLAAVVLPAGLTYLTNTSTRRSPRYELTV